MDKETIQKLAKQLFEAENTCVPIPPYTDNGYPDMTYEDAYNIQLAALDMKLAAGQKIVGKKVGLTNKNVQKKRGLTEPDYGHLLDNRICNQDEPLKMSELMVAPSIECEIAFVLKDDLMGPGVTAASVLAATAGVIPAIEIVERRFYPLCRNIVDSIADNAAFGRVILGDKMTPVEGLDFRTIGCLIEKNGQPIDTATASTVMGNPAESVAWLANKLAAYGVGLKKGEIIMSGSVGLMHTASAGECYYAHFGNGLGSVKVSFID